MIKKPLLAATLEDIDSLDYSKGWVVSPKLDGIRALIIDGIVLSRSFKPIRNKHVQSLFGMRDYDGVDGELIVGEPTSKTCYLDTNSGVMSSEGEPDVTFHVFDRFDVSGSFTDRVAQLPCSGGRIVRVPQHYITTKQQLLDLETKYLEMGFEGLMLRRPDGPYKEGRSTLKEAILLKLKRFADGEAVVTGIEEEMRNDNIAEKDELGHTKRSTAKAGLVGKGTMGALQVRDLVTGQEFSIGSGFTAVDREAPWEIGEIIKYKHFPIGCKDRPRFPVYLGRRDPDDMSK